MFRLWSARGTVERVVVSKVWSDGSLGPRLDGSMVWLVDGSCVRRLHSSVVGWIDGWMVRRFAGCMVGWMVGWADGTAERPLVQSKNKCTVNKIWKSALLYQTVPKCTYDIPASVPAFRFFRNRTSEQRGTLMSSKRTRLTEFFTQKALLHFKMHGGRLLKASPSIIMQASRAILHPRIKFITLFITLWWHCCHACNIKHSHWVRGHVCPALVWQG